MKKFIKNYFSFSYLRRTHSFTLVELLIVIGILAILTAAVVIVLNPAELLKQARDSKRMQDLASIHNALSLVLTQNPSASLGTPNTIYVSIPDSSSVCINLNLPTLPTGYTYSCAPHTTYTSATGTGWLPINLASSSIGSLPTLPIDPTNTTSSGLYYTYTTNGTQYELTTQTESTKGSTPAITDGGTLPGVYELGTNLTLTPETRDRGLVGYWKLNERTGVTAFDYSGFNNNGYWYSGSSTTSVQYTQDSQGRYVGLFDGTSQYIKMVPTKKISDSYSLSVWVAPSGFPANSEIISCRYPSDSAFDLQISSSYLHGDIGNGTSWINISANGNFSFVQNVWHHVGYIVSPKSYSIYVDGSLITSATLSDGNSLLFDSTHHFFIGAMYSSYGYFQGSMRDVRIYNRALSADEIKVLYNATK